MKISIVGAGNAGCAHAFKFSEKGHEVSIIKSSHSLHEDNFEAMRKQGGLWCIDNTNPSRLKKFQNIHLITRDVKEGLRDAEIVIILTQSLQHKEIAKRVKDYLPDSLKMLLIIPGNLGSLLFYNQLSNKNVIIAEGESTPYDARIIEPGVINILFKNVRNAISFLPVHKKNEGLSIANRLVDTYKYFRTNIVESALHNPNLIVHTVGVIMSASRIEMMKGEFWMYRESFSPSIWNLINQLDKEKNDIIEVFKGQRISYLDACKFRNEEDQTVDSLQVFNFYATNGGPKGPDSLNTRYIFEDVQNGLCLLSFLGKLCNIETPVTNALITIASSLVNYDFFSHTLDLEDYGISNMSLKDIITFINK